MTSVITRAPEPPQGGEPAPADTRRKAALALLVLVALAAWAVATGNGIYALGAFGFVVALLVSVTLHEGGHFLTARHYGMKATQFFVGFGPTLWSRRTGETEWGVKAIPAGGFVKIVGMTQLEEVEPGDERRAFWRQPARQRVVVLAAGSTVHFLIAIVLILGSALVIGKPVERSPGIGALVACVPATVQTAKDAAKAGADPCAGPGALRSPAQQAGLRAGDVVTAVDGRPVEGVLAFIEAVRASPGSPLRVSVERAGATREITVTPAPVQRTRFPAPGTDPKAVQPVVQVGAIGVAPQPRQATEQLNPVEAVGYSVTTAGRLVEGLATTVTEKLGTITQVYGPDRDPAGFVGVVGAGRVSGEVLASQETLGFKILAFLMLIAGLNFFVGVFNLLPLMPLDGGHIAVLAYEQARHRVRRLFGYTGELRRVDLRKLLPLTYAVVLLFAGFTLWLLGADIVNPIRIS